LDRVDRDVSGIDFAVKGAHLIICC
jgi:hypothetical protein